MSDDQPPNSVDMASISPKRSHRNPINEPPSQRQRLNESNFSFEDDFEDDFDNDIENLTPIDLSQVSIFNRLARVNLSDLIREDAFQNNRSFIEIQLMRIISPVNISGNQGAYIYSNRNRNRNNGSQTNYTRLFLGRVHASNEGSKLVYIMETRTQNRDLWKMNVEHRDDGKLTIGTVFRMLAPRPVESFMVGDIPLLVTKFPVIIMSVPHHFPRVSVDYQIQGNSAFAFVMRGMKLKVGGLTPIATSCSGLFCDRQRVDDWNGTERGCGCYAMHHRRSSIALQFDIAIMNDLDGEQVISMNSFSSNRFSKLFLTESISPSVLLQQLQFTNEFFALEDKVIEMVNYINENGGFTVIGWYKRGVINDRSLVSGNSNGASSNQTNDNVMVDNGEVNFHVTNLIPDSALVEDSEAFQALKFDVSRIG